MQGGIWSGKAVQEGYESLQAGGGGETHIQPAAATLPEKRNRPISHPGGPEQFPLTRSRWQFKHLMDGLSWPTVQAGYESIKACRVVICKKRNSPVLHLSQMATQRLQLPLTRHHRAGGNVARTCTCAAWWQLSDRATGFGDTCPITISCADRPTCIWTTASPLPPKLHCYVLECLKKACRL